MDVGSQISLGNIDVTKAVNPRLEITASIPQDMDVIKTVAMEINGGDISNLLPSYFSNILYVIDNWGGVNETLSNNIEHYSWGLELSAMFDNCWESEAENPRKPGFASAILYEFDEFTMVCLSLCDYADLHPRANQKTCIIGA